MKYLKLYEQYSSNKSGQVIEDRFIVDSYPVDILSDTKHRNGDRKIKYLSEDGERGGTWLFSYNEELSKDNSRNGYILVRGTALIVEERKIVHFRRSFTDINEANHWFYNVRRNNPQSQIVMEEHDITELKNYT